MVLLTDELMDELYGLMSDILSHEYPGSFTTSISDLGFPETFRERFRKFHEHVLSFNKKIDTKRLDDALSSSI